MTAAAGPQLLADLAATIATFSDELDEGRSLVARVVYAEPEQLTAQTALVASVSWKTWELLGKCGDLQLEQHLATVTLNRYESNATASLLEADFKLAEELRDYLAAWENASTRVLDVTGPAPFDLNKLVSPGQSEIVLTLDCDVLRNMADPRESTEEETPDEDYLLTAARMSAWRAFNNWSPLANVFARKYQSDSDLAEIQLRDPAPSELPALALYWGATEPAWQSNRTQTWPMQLMASVWLSGDAITLAEQTAQNLVDALNRSKPAPTVEIPDPPTYIHAGTAATPKRVGPIKTASVELGRTQKTRALRLDLTFVLRSATEPF